MTVPHLKEYKRLLSPELMFLCETKNRKQYMEKIQKILNYEHSYIVESMERAGGMVLYWSAHTKVLQVQHMAFTLEAYIEDQSSNNDWWMVGIYAFCDNSIRRQ